MTFPSHGAVRSSAQAAAESMRTAAATASSSSSSSPSLLQSCVGNSGLSSLGNLTQSCRSFTSSTSSSALSTSSLSQTAAAAAAAALPPPAIIPPLPTNNRRMNPQERQSNLWHPSRGFVFASDTRVVYPRLPTARFYSAPAVVSRSEDDASVTAGRGVSTESVVAADKAPETRDIAIPSSNPGSALTTGEETKRSEPATTALQNSSAAEEPTKDPIDLEPPFTPLEYKIPPEVFRAAKLAPEGSLESYWSYNLYRGPDENGDLNTKIKVHYCTSHHTTERVLQNYFVDEKILGFDLEWEISASDRSGARKNVCLVQLASKTRIGLFHLSLYSEKSSLVAPSLKKIMEDPSITKLGVAIKGDCTRLRKFLDIDSRGVFELSNLYKLVKYSTSGEYQFINRRIVRLAVQCEEYLGLPLFKGSDVRSSNWSQPLKMDQIIYSASDAYAAVQLFAILDHHRQNLDPTPPLPYFVEENRPIPLADGIVLPTAEEPAPQDGDTEAKLRPEPSDKYLDSLKDTIEIEGEGESSESIPSPSGATPSKPATKSAQTPPPPPKDQRVLDASALAAEYRIAKPPPPGAKSTTYATPAQLRAYYLWYKNADLGPKEIAALLRTPPLQTNTVVGYILETIRLEKVNYDSKRLREELLSCVPKDILASSRYYKYFL